MASDTNDYIAETCIAYLLHFNDPTLQIDDIIRDFPLAEYAARYWIDHAQQACNGTEVTTVHQLCMELFGDKNDTFLKYLKIADLRHFSVTDYAIPH